MSSYEKMDGIMKTSEAIIMCIGLLLLLSIGMIHENKKENNPFSAIGLSK